jgi:phospholipid N-methyltransferase
MSTQSSDPEYPSFVERAKTVFTTWLENPSQVSSLVPSSQALTQCIADRHCVRDASLVVDLGPGTGETTRALLAQMRPSSRLLAIEVMEELVEPLRKISDSRLVVKQGDARKLRQFVTELEFGTPDVVVSGIPFSTLDTDDADSIVNTIHGVLREGGEFIAYQFLANIQEIAEPRFGKATVKRVWKNLPPLRVYTWIK